MPLFSRFFPRWWLLIPLGAAVFIAGTGYSRARHAIRLQDLNREAGPANYADGRHWLVVPEHNSRSYQWLAETEQMLTRHEGRIRHIDYENAPAGREVASASPFRWWLGLLAGIDHQLTNHSVRQSVETAALWSGPLLHLLLLAATTAYVARRFGVAPAAFVSLGLAVLFPLAGDFVAAVPDDHGLAIALAGATVLLLAGGLRGSRGDFILSGVSGGVGLWIDATVMVPVLGAVALGALVLAIFERRTTASVSGGTRPTGKDRNVGGVPSLRVDLPWDRWALAGGITSLLAYLVEFYPSHLDLRLQVNHPVYGLIWIGAGQALMLAGQWAAHRLRWSSRTVVAAIVAIAGLAALPVTMRLAGGLNFLTPGPQASQLGNLTNSPVAANLLAWFRRDGVSVAMISTLLPLLILLPVAWGAWRRNAAPAARQVIVLGGVTLFATCALAAGQLQWWGLAQLLLLVIVAGAWPAAPRAVWLVTAFALIPGLVQVAGTARARTETQLTRLEIEGLIERDIAHWIADHAAAPGAIVLVAPERTPAFNFFGGLRGLATPSAENEAGVTAAVRLMASGTAEEAQAQLAERAVTHLVLLSWDQEVDELVRLAYHNPQDTFLAALRNWALPPWLQPLPYPLPEIAGFEGQQAAVLAVTENADRALALGRMADYALEMRNEALAAAVNDALKAFPANLGALVARAQVEKARGNDEEFARLLESIVQIVTNKHDQMLPWDRRVGLAVVLAQGKRTDLATVQVRRCIAELDVGRLRALGAGSLYRLLVLSRALNVPVPAELQDYALTLLPAEARARL